MARHISDQNKLVFLHESGTYATTSGNGLWIGEVTEHSLDDNENKIENRYLGALTRSVSDWVQGPSEITGTITYHPQDMRLLFWAIGSVNIASGTTARTFTNQVNTGNRLNPFVSGTNDGNVPFSFTLEDSKTSAAANSNFVRTVRGCVINQATLTASEGEKVQLEIEYIGASLTHGSGTTTSVTASTRRPYLWSDCTLTLSGTSIITAKEVVLTVNNNMEGPHYVAGSRNIGGPLIGNRENTLSVTMDTDDSYHNLIYRLYKDNSVFNTSFDLNADNSTGSQHTILAFSGCRILSAEIPSPSEGVNEATFELGFPTIIGSVIDGVFYNAY